MAGSDAEPLAALVRLMLWSAAQASKRMTDGLPRLADNSWSRSSNGRTSSTRSYGRPAS
jgi:hypothetical protein